MHKDDQMTPLERQAAMAKGEAVDRYPIGMFYGAPGHALLGWTRRDEVASARNSAEVLIKVYETFGCDGVSVPYSLHGFAMRYGAKMTDPEHAPIAILEHPLQDINDLSMLDLDDISVEKDPILKNSMEKIKIIQDRIGHECSCGQGMVGPFSSIAGLLGADVLLRNLNKNPEQVHKLMEFATEATKILTEPFLKEGLTISLADPVASGTLISRKKYQEFVAPYTKRLVDFFDKFNPNKTMIHICGDTTSILEDIAQSGCSSISIDNVVDLQVAKEKIGSAVYLIGNVNPNGALYLGMPEDVRAAVRACCRQGWDSPRGYMIATGCDSVYGTPLENSLAFVDEARKCAQYPWNLDNFAE